MPMAVDMPEMSTKVVDVVVVVSVGPLATIAYRVEPAPTNSGAIDAATA